MCLSLAIRRDSPVTVLVALEEGERPSSNTTYVVPSDPLPRTSPSYCISPESSKKLPGKIDAVVS